MMRKTHRVIFLACLLLNFSIIWESLIFAETATKGNQTEEFKQLVVGQSEIYPTHTPTRIVIGNPEVVDVVDVTEKQITINAKASGTTTLVYWDLYGENSVKIKVISEDMNEIKRRVDNLLSKLNLPDVYAKAENDEAKVLLLGKVKHSLDLERINIALATLKDKIVNLVEVKEEETGVQIDVQVLELNKDATTVLGITNPLSTTDGLTFTEVGSPGIAAAGTKWSTLFKVLNLKRDAFAWTIYAFVQEGKARVLSRPRIVCQSGKEAELLVGGEKPIMTTTVAATTGTSGTNVEYKEYGIKLKIKPVVNEEKRIKLSLNVDITEVASTTPEFIGSSGSATAKAYPFNKRVITTEIFLNDQQTLAIGGLIKQKTEEDVQKTPWLGDLPVIGMFFRQKQKKVGGGKGERGDTELYIMLTPTVIDTREKEEKTAVSPAAAVPQKEIKPQVNLATLTLNENVPAPLRDYISLIQRRIVDNLSYPLAAKESGFQGIVKLALRLSYSGELLDAAVKSSSGYKILDEHAINVAKGIATYPPFPPSVDQKELWVEVPIVYRLD